MTSTSFFHDDPIDSKDDELGRRPYVDTLVGSFKRISDRAESSITALIAPWGAGKTSVLRMLTSELESTHGWAVRPFTPWDYTGVESATLGFFDTLRDALPKDKKWNQTRDTLGRIVLRVAPATSVASFIGVDPSKAVEAIGKAIGGDATIPTLLKRVNDSLSGLDNPILVVLDDVDRLTPPEILNTFKLIRNLGRLPNVHYLLAYDERTLLDLIRKADLTAHDEGRARDYLEKMVQVRFDLPVFRAKDTDELLSAYLGQLTDDYSIELEEQEWARFREAYRSCIRERLTTPRSVKRFIGQVDAFLGTMVNEVNFIDLLLTTFIRVAEPSLWATLPSHRGLLTGTDMMVFARRRSPEQNASDWGDVLDAAKVSPSHQDAVTKVLSVAFPALGNHLAGTAGGDYRQAARRGAGSADYFDRYFTHGVPSDDIADGIVRLGAAQIENDERAEEAAALIDQLTERPEPTFRKLREAHEARIITAVPLIELMAAICDEVTDARESFLSDPTSLIQKFTAELLVELATEDHPSLPAMISGIAASNHGLRLLANATFWTTKFDDVDETASATLVSHISPILGERIVEANWQAEDGGKNDPLRLLHLWYLLDPSAFRSSMLELNVAGKASPLDVLARLVGIAYLITGRDPIFHLSDLNIDAAMHLYDLQEIVSQLSAQVSDASPPDEHAEPSVSNRRRVALHALKRWAQETTGAV